MVNAPSISGDTHHIFFLFILDSRLCASHQSGFIGVMGLLTWDVLAPETSALIKGQHNTMLCLCKEKQRVNEKMHVLG